MRKTNLLLMASTLISLVLILQACDKDDDTEPNEFIAESSTFANFDTWSLDFTAQGADPALGNMAHGGNDSTVTREVFFKDGQTPSSGEYPIGTVIVKRSTNPGGTVEEYTAMVKRGSTFNPANNGWEWFMLMADGSIAEDPNSGEVMRGALLMNGMCGNCHNSASTDFVFSK